MGLNRCSDDSDSFSFTGNSLSLSYFLLRVGQLPNGESASFELQQNQATERQIEQSSFHKFLLCLCGFTVVNDGDCGGLVLGCVGCVGQVGCDLCGSGFWIGGWRWVDQ